MGVIEVKRKFGMTDRAMEYLNEHTIDTLSKVKTIHCIKTQTDIIERYKINNEELDITIKVVRV